MWTFSISSQVILKAWEFFSKLWVPGCGTTCYQTQASPGYFNPQIVPTQTPVMECNLIRCDGWEEMLPGCDLISCWLSPIHCPFAFLLQIQFVPINPRETFFPLKSIFENEFIVETENLKTGSMFFLLRCKLWRWQKSRVGWEWASLSLPVHSKERWWGVAGKLGLSPHLTDEDFKTLDCAVTYSGSYP